MSYNGGERELPGPARSTSKRTRADGEKSYKKSREHSKKANVGIYDGGTHEFTLFVGLALQYGGAHLGPSGSRLMRLMER